MPSIPIRKRKTQSSHKEEGHGKTGAETAVMQLRVSQGTKEFREPPEAGKGKESVSPGAFRGSTALISDVWPPELVENTFLLF